jgi:hypothetical protein
MTKLLNLDELEVSTQRSIKLRGNSYAVRDLNVRQFVQFQRHFGEFQKAYAEDRVEDMLAAATALVELAAPEFTSQVDSLNPMQLMAVVALIANLFPAEAEETGGGEGNVEAPAEATPE